MSFTSLITHSTFIINSNIALRLTEIKIDAHHKPTQTLSLRDSTPFLLMTMHTNVYMYWYACTLSTRMTEKLLPAKHASIEVLYALKNSE